jgi:hypothetical protein
VSIHNIQRELDAAMSDGVGLQVGDSSSDKIAFLGATPVVQRTAFTSAVTTITNAGTPGDYAIQALTQTSPWGFVEQDEGESLVEAVLNNQARIGEIEVLLQAFGFVA